jgi:hypothetical protein
MILVEVRNATIQIITEFEHVSDHVSRYLAAASQSMQDLRGKLVVREYKILPDLNVEILDVHLQEESQPLQKVSGMTLCSVSVDDLFRGHFFINTVFDTVIVLLLPVLLLPDGCLESNPVICRLLSERIEMSKETSRH